jgi:LPS export ABC transporter protein LptC
MRKGKITGRLKCLLFFFVAACFGFIAWIFLHPGERIAESPNPEIPSPKPGLQIGKIKHSSTRNGVLEWELEADSAEYTNENKEAILHDLSLIVHLKDNEKAFVRAEEGALNTDIKNIRLNGNVILKKQGYTFMSERLAYAHEKRLIHTETPVTIEGNSLHLRADAMTIDLNTNITTLKGNVKGDFYETAHP